MLPWWPSSCTDLARGSVLGPHGDTALWAAGQTARAFESP